MGLYIIMAWTTAENTLKFGSFTASNAFSGCIFLNLHCTALHSYSCQKYSNFQEISYVLFFSIKKEACKLRGLALLLANTFSLFAYKKKEISF